MWSFKQSTPPKSWAMLLMPYRWLLLCYLLFTLLLGLFLCHFIKAQTNKLTARSQYYIQQQDQWQAQTHALHQEILHCKKSAQQHAYQTSCQKRVKTLSSLMQDLKQKMPSTARLQNMHYQPPLLQFVGEVKNEKSLELFIDILKSQKNLTEVSITEVTAASQEGLFHFIVHASIQPD